tara:strand:+ start:318 stop:482 length:165 start_codon:yes stop_codon:yes gene_type:complete
MTNADKISKLIEITELLTKRCAKIEKDALTKILTLEERITKLENETWRAKDGIK